MSTAAATATAPSKKRDPERAHRLRVHAAAIAAFCFVMLLLANGIDYYRLPLALRPFSPKHDMLKPSGTVGLKLGILGVCLFGCIFLYPIRKHWPWLRRMGNSKHWLDFHIVMGLTAPWIIACHSSFKFSGFAGLAFWTMSTVALSGVVGRYLYAQIPRQMNSAELSLGESKELQQHLMRVFEKQTFFTPSELEPLFRVPDEDKVQRWSLGRSLAYMVQVDLSGPFQIARLRRRSLSLWERIVSLGGLLRSRHRDLEVMIDLARTQSALARRIVFLSHAQRIFRLWHVVHKPFSFSFIVLALIHIGVILSFGIPR